MKKYKMPDSICDNPKQQIGYWFENGVQLSGGQWQRLAICRTMARDNEILLLDEPNAALDAITFRMLYNEINAQANRKVCVMLLQHFVNFIGGNEEICVFDDGRNPISWDMLYNMVMFVPFGIIYCYYQKHFRVYKAVGMSCLTTFFIESAQFILKTGVVDKTNRFHISCPPYRFGAKSNPDLYVSGRSCVYPQSFPQSAYRAMLPTPPDDIAFLVLHGGRE